MVKDPQGRYKRRTFSSALAPLLRGRARYAVLALLLAVFSLPLVADGPMFGGFLEFPPVAAVLRAVGLADADSSGAGDPGELVKAAIAERELSPIAEKAKAAPGSCGDDCGRASSAEMMKSYAYVSAGRAASGGITVLSEAEAEGATDLVYLGKAAYGAAGSERTGRGAPYLGPEPLSGVVSRGDGLYASALRYGDSMAPAPGRPVRAGAGYSGRPSAFSWRDLARYTGASSRYKRFGGKRPMSQLAQAFSAASSVSSLDGAKLETQAAYAGAVYDGGAMDLDSLVTEGAPSLPDSGFVDDLGSASGMKRLAERCSDAQGFNGARLSDIGREMDEIQSGMTDPPSCGGVSSPWNLKVARLYRLCLDFNRNQAELAQDCQTSGARQMDCGIYASDTENDGLIVKRCDKQRSGLAAVLSVPAALITAALARLQGD